VSVPGLFNGWDAAGLAGAAALGAGYAVGVVRLWRRAGGRRGLPAWSVAAAAVGWLALVAGLGPPLALLADLRFAAHMGQHEILMLVAAPLLALGQPLLALLWALPPRARERVGGWVRRPGVRAGWHRLTAPFVVLLLQILVLAIWHLPGPFDLALRHDGLHAFQHLSFFLVAALFWWALVHGRFGRFGYGAGVLVVFVTATWCGLLGAWLVVAPASALSHARRARCRAACGRARRPAARRAADVGPRRRGAARRRAGALRRLARRHRPARRAHGDGARDARALVLVLLLSQVGCFHRQLAVASATVGDAERGQHLAYSYGCAACHMIPGVPGGRVVVGPPLVDLRLRVVIAGRVPATPENLARFIRYPREVTPGTAMPDLGVSAHDARDIAAYLLAMP
jgi:cytochrome c oxidase assembly factor CtaG/cytochrome c2